ncbi:MAG: HEAT repeat domain-containing protein [Labilithrix sp.]|nr:HEAT repeat domain-containing protein [Labilithrix sp.]
MTSRHRSLALVAAVALVTASAIALSRRHAESAPDGVADASRPSFAHAFTPGRRLTYEVDYRSEALVESEIERPALGENAPRRDGVLTLSSAFAGTLTAAVVERHDDGSARVLATLRDLEVSVLLSDRAVVLPDATFAPLARGFIVEYGPAGNVRGVEVERDAHPIAVRLASQIVAFLQLVAPRDHGATWETDETDPLGELRARYALVDDAPSHDGGQVIQKLVTRTVAPRTSGALGRLIATGGASGTATLAYEVSPAEGILLEAAGALTTEQVIGDLRVGSDDSTLLVRLTADDRVGIELLREEAHARAAALGKLRPLDPVELRTADRRRENEALLAQIDLAAVVADARAHPPPPQSRDAATYARLLAAAVDASPDGRALLEKAMLEPAIDERTFVPLARAFGEDGSPDAQAALGRVVSGRAKADPGREVALFALGRADAPADATISMLETLSRAADDPHRYAALLALGRAAGQLAATDPARGAPVLDRVLARAEDAPDDAERARVLEAIGNAGSSRAEPALARWSRADVAPVVRRAAVGAYRLVPTRTARDALIAALRDDADPSVRSAALEAVLVRTPDDGIADAVADRLERDPDESVKKPAASRLMTLCRRVERACAHVERLQKAGDEWTRHELAAFRRP